MSEILTGREEARLIREKGQEVEQPKVEKKEKKETKKNK